MPVYGYWQAGGGGGHLAREGATHTLLLSMRERGGKGAEGGESGAAGSVQFGGGGHHGETQ
ncbi:hypothetical protein AMTR_s00022p00240150 [Amborella trichopoda]|uniref:Uncharacterized protein n=1 Tax=Amborella trichopoda TaxID=13333 RepID=W1PVM2_AMBTC|nr:hypothetical protein AMTR_s00022p00240150 [Amborella trichopoda]